MRKQRKLKSCHENSKSWHDFKAKWSNSNRKKLCHEVVKWWHNL